MIATTMRRKLDSCVLLQRELLKLTGFTNKQNVYSPLRTRCYNIVTPGKVSATRKVPNHIMKPPYVHSTYGAQFDPSVNIGPQGDKIEIKREKAIQGMREACKLARIILYQAGEKVKEGVTTDEIDEYVHTMTLVSNAYPSPLLYKGFPKSVCTSVNNVACHGIPDDTPLQNGDLINIDVTVYYNGYHGDTSETFMVGDVDAEGEVLLDVASACREAGIKVCGHGIPFSAIGSAISEEAAVYGYNIIPDFCGHGIGHDFHANPTCILQCENDYDIGVMQEGMTFTVEPIITEGDPEVKILKDGWTVVSKDNSRSAQFEHTILITVNGAEILTV